MPMPTPLIEITEDWVEQAFYERAKWTLKFIWWPKRCNLSGQLLWFCYAYEGEAVWTGPGTPVYEFRYHKTVEHLIWFLKGNI
jgi:hypothetical protein